MSATSGTSSVSSGTLGNAPPVSFPGVSSGIDYNSIIEKYTEETLAQEKPTLSQINNLNSQNTAILKIQNLLGAVQDSLTSLSDPQTFGAFKATIGTTAGGQTAASAKQIPGQTAIAGSYQINSQTLATATVLTNNISANGTLDTTDPLAVAGTAVTASNGTAANGKFTINGILINYDANTETIVQIVSQINAALQSSDGGSATLNANGTVTLTGVTSLGSGGDSGNLEQVLKLDTAQVTPLTLNPAQALGNESLATQPTANTLNLNALISADPFTTTPTPTGGQIIVNGQAINWITGESLQTLFNNIQSVTALAGVPATVSVNSSNEVTFSGLTGAITDTTGNLTSVLNLGAATGTAPNETQVSTSSTIPLTGIQFTGAGGTGQIFYDPAVDSLAGIVAQVNGQTGATGVSATIVGGTITFSGLTSAVSDLNGGNLTAALQLGGIAGGVQTNSAPLTRANTNDITSSSPINGINQNVNLNTSNNAGFATAVTAGTFTINGVQFTVDPTKNSLSDLITKINSSSAGVTATYNTSTSQLTLTSKVAGPQSILLGAGSDTSNFLSAAGLTNGNITQGTQASLSYTDSGGVHTVFSATNDFTNVIPGIDLTLTQSTATGYSVSVATDPKAAETAINAFVKAFNAAIQELNKDTVAPTVTAGTNASNGTSTSSSSGGGVLYGNFQISGLRDQLVNMVSGFIPTGSTSYNSLASIGLLLDTTSQTVGAQDADSDSSSDTSLGSNNSFSVTGATSGQLAALDTTTFEAAYAANPAAIQQLFTSVPTFVGGQSTRQITPGSTYGFAYLLGSTLANTDGVSTFLKNRVIIPDNLASVLLTSITDSNNSQIDSLEQQIKLVNQEATAQADSLRQQFSASESQIAQLQALQAQIAAIGH